MRHRVEREEDLHLDIHNVRSGPMQVLGSGGTALVAHIAIRMRSGMKAAFPLKALGEIGVEAG